MCTEGRWHLCASRALPVTIPGCSFPGSDELIRPAERFTPVPVKTEHCNSSLLLLFFLTQPDLPIPPDDFEEKKCSAL